MADKQKAPYPGRFFFFVGLEIIRAFLVKPFPRRFRKCRLY
ncbi:hypothetical protein ACOZ4Y_07380 [Komagataeibacter rhaeticus]|nr:hypothetical protein [Komagataeibacter rhaeticus]